MSTSKSYRKEEIVEVSSRDQRQGPQPSPSPLIDIQQQSQSGQLNQTDQVVNTSFTHTEARAPLYTPPAPTMLVTANLAQDLVGESQTQSSARIVSTAQDVSIPEAGYLAEEARQDEEKKRRELAELEVKNVKETERQTEQYRKEAEEKAEKIRRELEAQHAKDVEFRKNLVQQAVDTQKKQIDVEEKFAKKELDRERKIAESALDQSRLQTVAEVSLDTAAGKATSSGTVVSETVTVSSNSSEQQQQDKSIGTKLKEWLLGSSPRSD